MKNFINITKILTESVVPEGSVEGKSVLGPVSYDQERGVGNVPNNQSVNYMGFAVLMTQPQFSRLAASRDFDESSSLAGLMKALDEHKPFGSPFLDVSFSNDIPKVMGHEGRTRCKAIQMNFGAKTPILVHVLLRGGDRARHITLEDIAKMRMEAIPEKQSRPIQGPHFSDQVWHLGSWHTLP